MNKMLRALLGSLLILGLFQACGPEKPLRNADPEVVAAFTAGPIGKDSVIKVVFTKEMVTSPQEAVGQPFVFEPGIPGKAQWLDPVTLAFKPEKPLNPGQKFRGTLVMSTVPGSGKAGDFDFAFYVPKPTLNMNLEGLHAGLGTDGAEVTSITGTLVTNHREDPAALERALSVEVPGQKVAGTWVHEADGKTHRFTLGPIQRQDQKIDAQVSWNGSGFGAQDQGRETVTIPAKGSFEVVSIKPKQLGENFIEVRFSSPLQKNQDLRGLISVEGQDQLKYVVNDNLVKVYSPEPLVGQMKVQVQTGIKSLKNIPLQTIAAGNIGFVNEKPQVRWANKGVIIPTSQGVTLPIETLNLRGVVVEVLRIYGSNMSQFLQVNDLDGGSELNRVGKVVLIKNISTNFKPEQKDKWILQGLDLSEITKKYPDGMFRVRVTFQRSQVVWNNMENLPEEDPRPVMGAMPAENSYWDGAEDWYEDGGYDNYQSRLDPASPAYYKRYYDHDIAIARNVMVSNVALVSKRSTDGSYMVYAANLVTAQPLEGAKIQVMDYTNQVLATLTTNKEGFVEFKPAEEPAFIFAQAQGQFGYLKIASGEALSISHFDAGGAKNEKGLNGFIYAERGVWRPGDTVHLTFILKDPAKVLPAGHPVQLDVINPQGKTAYKKVLTQGLNGFYYFPFATGTEDPTGDYLARVRVGGRTFERPLKIETVKPNTLKINLDLSANGEVLSSGQIKGRLQSERLTGAKVSGLRAEIQATFAPGSTSFPKYSEYVFDDPSREFRMEKQTLWSGNLDQDGVANIDTMFYPEISAGGMVKAFLTTRVFEDTGDFSIESTTTNYSPYSRYVGILMPKGDAARGMLLTDTDHTVRIALVDKDGKPLNGTVRAKIFQVNWRWWWESGNDNLAEYVSQEGRNTIKEDDVEVKNGYAEWKFQVKYPSWGRYLVQVEDVVKGGGHRTGKVVYIDWPGWAGRAQKEGSGATMLMLSSDKTKYNTGDTATVTFPSNDQGRALVALEAGGRIIRSEWVKGAKDTTKYTFKVTDDMAPNIYVHVSFIQPHLQTLNDRPIRVYGLMPLMVESPQTRLNPIIQTADAVAPKANMVVQVSEASKRPMTYTLAVVDEGLLGLTAYKAPNPWDHFFKREASLVQTFDLYDWVVNAYNGKLENQLSIGGDGDAANAAKKKPSRFEPVVKFLAPRTLAAGAVNTETIQLPNYIGAVRVMVVAAGNEKAFGKAEKEVKVTAPLMVQPLAPRVLTPGEEIEIPVTVFNYNAAVKSVDVSLRATGPVALVVPMQRAQFTGEGEKVLTFRLKTYNTLGQVTLTTVATANGPGDKPNGQRADSPPINLEVRVPGTVVYDVKKYELAALGTKTEQINFVGIPGTNQASLEISMFPSFDLGKRLDYLIRYPYGCIEQTTSSVFPQLQLKNLQDLDKTQQDRIQSNIIQAIDRLKTFQTSRGGFAYWPGQSDDSTWGTNYAGHFLLEAKALGYSLPDGLLDRWITFQKNKASTWSDGNDEEDLTQAYRLYTLALAGAADLGSMNRLMSMNIGSVAKWRLAAAYQLAGQREAASKLALSAALETIKYTNPAISDTFGSELRDKAMILEVLALMNINDQRTRDLADSISRDLSSEAQSYPTQTTAYALLALGKYRTSVPAGTPIKVKLEWDGKTEELTTTKPLLLKDLGIPMKAFVSMTITNLGSAPIFPRLQLAGIPGPEKVQARESGLKLSISYLRDGKNRVPSISSAPLAQGGDWTIELEVSNTLGRDLKNLALNHLVAGGFEIANSRMAGEAVPPGADYQDIRDDRVYTYFGLKKNETKRFQISVNATYLGKFYLPMVSVGAMYDPNVQAVVPGQWISIEKSGR